MILECQGVCRANMGIIFKLLCPGDVPSKAHKLILNSTTSVLYEHMCIEKHHADVVYDLWKHDYEGWPLLDNNTNELIEYPVEPIWGDYDQMPWNWEIMLRELLLNNCIQFTIFENYQ